MNWIAECKEAAVAKVRVEVAKPIADERELCCDETFDPWALFPAVYGSYSADFDWTMLDVLRSLDLAARDDWDAAIALQRDETLAHHIFREMLCTANLCDYGTSPRVCFATTPFREVLAELIAKWEAYSRMQWGERDSDTRPKDGDGEAGSTRE